MMRWRKVMPVALGLGLLMGSGGAVFAADSGCPFPGQTPMLVVQLFFGRSIEGRAPVTDGEWQGFVDEAVTPRLPNGFTVYDARGQWLDDTTHLPARETTKVLVVAAPDTAALHAGIAAVIETYQRRFHQRSVGIVTNSVCAAF